MTFNLAIGNEMETALDAGTTIEQRGKAYLQSWAEKTRGGVHLGLPTSSVEQRGDRGGVMSAATDLTLEDEITDRAVARMALKQGGIHYRVIDLWFKRGLAMPQMMKALRVSRSEGYRMLNKACGKFWRVRQGL
jgi:hypothetical protein